MQQFQNKRETEITKLNIIYKFIMQEYFQSERTKNIILSEFDSQDIVGDGPLDDDSRKKVIELVDANLALLSIEELEIYWDVKSEYEVRVLDYDMGNSEDYHPNVSNTPTYYYFDVDKKFISHIKKESKEIQDKYYN